MKITEKSYKVEGAEFIQRPLGTFQLMRLALVAEELSEELKKAFTKIVVDGEADVDITALLMYFEKNPSLLARLLEVVMIDVKTNKPVYLSGDEVKAPLVKIINSAETFLEVVADFFTFNDLSRIASSFLRIRAMSPTLFQASGKSSSPSAASPKK